MLCCVPSSTAYHGSYQRGITLKPPSPSPSPPPLRPQLTRAPERRGEKNKEIGIQLLLQSVYQYIGMCTSLITKFTLMCILDYQIYFSHVHFTLLNLL